MINLVISHKELILAKAPKKSDLFKQTQGHLIQKQFDFITAPLAELY